ncbi:hypothetical protein N7532_006559 [Penicillium argentinense]|uniref:PQ loop repeat protein n=1 Tax=Penicillium argentinense TaxID=1131581 RepID=A0A9W9FG46_9EURO|nr:uncharacterized protein N7532_006559 [Penicillium argentinense]KAJ5099558.1 hypothetical protein N7532_006559 [Penicillium argentinense]
MFPPQAVNLNIEALSGICGSISIACWVVVFSPQIIENFRRGSADGLSLLFLIVWLAGDVFNILGAVLQGVLPTMIILAVYYTLADIVLLGQCFYYRGFDIRDELSPTPPSESDPVATGALEDQEGDGETTPTATERSSLLPKTNGHSNLQQAAGGQSEYNTQSGQQPVSSSARERRHSASSFRDILHHHVDGTHLSPATPFIDSNDTSTAAIRRSRRRITTLQTCLFNLTAIFLVCAAGIVGWYFSPGSKSSSSEPEPLTMDPLGQVFGYLCAVLYLGSRLPQLLLNYRRKSTDGVSLLFFLFACIGNLTYVLSIFAYSPVCRGVSSLVDGPETSAHRHHAHCQPGEAAALYGRYILVNMSWLVGSAGTLLLDMAIFVQFFLYRDEKDFDYEHEGEE